jgi:hypothetical protein
MEQVKIFAPKPQLAVIEMLERQLERARAGEISRLGIVFEQPDGCWGSEFSRSDDSRVDAAMLIELAMRRLGLGKQ